MRRLHFVLAGSLCLFLAVLLHPVSEEESAGALAAVGQSMGGSRVMVIDALFLRAEAQRKAGRIEDAAALYQAVLDLDPANEAATIFLVNVYVDELIPQIPDAAERHAWWLDARGLLATALARRPRSAPLHARAAGLVLDGRRPGGALDARPAAEIEQASWEALRHLDQAVRFTDTLPRRGRVHLVQIGLLTPELAAEALRDGDEKALREALAIGDGVLRTRAAVLETLGLGGGRDTSLADVLRAGLGAVRATRAAIRGVGDPATAQARIAACQALVPGWPTPEILTGLLAK